LLKPIPENFDDICEQKLTYMNKINRNLNRNVIKYVPKKKKSY